MSRHYDITVTIEDVDDAERAAVALRGAFNEHDAPRMHVEADAEARRVVVSARTDSDPDDDRIAAGIIRGARLADATAQRAWIEDPAALSRAAASVLHALSAAAVGLDVPLVAASLAITAECIGGDSYPPEHAPSTARR